MTACRGDPLRGQRSCGGASPPRFRPVGELETADQVSSSPASFLRPGPRSGVSVRPSRGRAPVQRVPARALRWDPAVGSRVPFVAVPGAALLELLEARQLGTLFFPKRPREWRDPIALPFCGPWGPRGGRAMGGHLRGKINECPSAKRPAVVRADGLLLSHGGRKGGLRPAGGPRVTAPVSSSCVANVFGCHV